MIKIGTTILVPFDEAKPNELQALIYVDSFSIDRNGKTAMPPASGVTDKWRVGWNVRSVLAENGVAVLRNGQEVDMPVPAGYGSSQADVARLLHDPETAAVVGLLLPYLTRLMTRELIPTTQEAP